MEEVKEKIPGMVERRIEYCRFIARLTGNCENRQKEAVVGSENMDFNVALSLLKENKVPLAYINNGTGGVHSEFFDFPEFRKECEKEQILNRSLRDQWTCVREEFLKAGIESMLIKSVGVFPYKSSNLDVLIKQSRRREAELSLRRMGYIQIHNVEEPYKTLFRKFYRGKTISIIHLHDKVAWINPFHDEQLLWNRYHNSRTDGVVDTPSPEDNILILTAHWFYEDKELKLSDIMNISSCLRKSGLDWSYMTGVARKMGWLNGLYFALLVQSFLEKNIYGHSSIERERLAEMEEALPRWMRAYLKRKIYDREVSLPFKLEKLFCKFLHFVKTLEDTTVTRSRKLYEIWAVAWAAFCIVLIKKFSLNIRSQKPMLICFSGVDGSGKTTYAEIVRDILMSCELRTRLVWSRVGSSGFLKPFSKTAKILYGSRKGKKIRSEYCQESEAIGKDLFKKSSVLRTLGLSLLLLEMVCQYFFKVTLPLLLGKAVICDRYIYDTLIDMATRYDLKMNSSGGRLFSGVLTALTPKPDFAYVLDLSLEDVCNRRETDFGEKSLIREQIDLYKKISTTYNLEQINNDRAIGKISNEMIHEILTGYYKKWESIR